MMKSMGTRNISYSSHSKCQAKIRKNVALNNSVITLIIYSFNKYYISTMADLLHVGEEREHKDKKLYSGEENSFHCMNEYTNLGKFI